MIHNILDHILIGGDSIQVHFIRSFREAVCGNGQYLLVENARERL
jgi:hypothetical protein